MHLVGGLHAETISRQIRCLQRGASYVYPLYQLEVTDLKNLWVSRVTPKELEEQKKCYAKSLEVKTLKDLLNLL